MCVVTCERPEGRRQERVGEQRLQELPVVLVEQSGESSDADPEHQTGFISGSEFELHLSSAGLVPVRGSGFQRSVAEAAIALPQVEIVVMVMVTGPAQPVPALPQLHLDHLIEHRL